jgi:hypothetical protein
MQLQNARYNTPEHTSFDVDVVLDGETFPFSYHPLDGAPLTLAIDDYIADGGLEIADYVAPPAALLPLSARQFHLALALNGLAEPLEDAIATIPEPSQTLIRIEFERATEFRRDYPLLVSLSTALGLTDEQVDGMWLEAGAL